jgi:acyl carrier protein
MIDTSDTAAETLSATERTIAEIWAQDLDVSPVARDSDFFALGGDSLNMLTVLFRVGQALGIEVSPETLYHHPTLEQFSRAVDDMISAGGTELETGTI